MPSQWLLAAEADQIQDLLFRVPHLREVVGGSQLIERFCREVPGLLLDDLEDHWQKSDLIISGGGAFRVVLKTREQALAFGEALAEAYRRLTGGHLSVAAPVSLDGVDWRTANDAAHAALSSAKRGGSGASAPVQQPYAAICASCGIGLATRHAQRRTYVLDERPDYLCNDCATKFHEPFQCGRGRRQAFLSPFRRAVGSRLTTRPYRLNGPGDGDWADMIGGLDPNRYVAYLSADSNGMGLVFSQCPDKRATSALSKRLGAAMRDALASQCAGLIDLLRARRHPLAEQELMPVLPLILGGDDLFALLPARWSIDIAYRYVRAYEQAMARALEKLELADDLELPSISAVVVICKCNYPHALARRRCDRELGRAKQLAHRHPGGASVLGMTVITGNQTGGGADDGGGDTYCPTLSPYPLVNGDDPIERLFDHRRVLAGDAGEGLPQKRRAELERLFDQAPEGTTAPAVNRDLEERWMPRLRALRRRILRDEARGSALDGALKALGSAQDEALGYWMETPRPWTRHGADYGHGLPDLLRLWSFLERIESSGGEASA